MADFGFKPQQWLLFCSGYEYHQAVAALGPNVHWMPNAFDLDAMDALIRELAAARHGIRRL